MTIATSSASLPGQFPKSPNKFILTAYFHMIQLAYNLRYHFAY